MTKLAVYGLGAMGLGMARSCLRAGLTTFGVDVQSERMQSFVAEGGDATPLSQAVSDLDAVLIVVLNAMQTESVLFGDSGVASKLPNGAVIISCATVPPDFARDMEHRCEEAGLHYLDAPISGGAAKSAKGELTIMASGRPDSFKAAEPVLDAISERVFHLGDMAGQGSAMKAVNQLLAGVHIAAMAEAMTFGMAQGVAPDKFLEVIPKCAGTSWMLENRAPHIVDADYTPFSQVNIWPKDLGIVLDIAKQAGFDAPITKAALQQFLSAVEMGLGGEDDAAVAKAYAEQAGLTLPGQS